jgi:NAD-dependent histone deacetylase SIR2
MGNEESLPLDQSLPPETLDSRTVEAVAKYINTGRPKKIVVLSGAGISTSAGIPDFRSPGTGLYANLARLNLPYAEAVFDISYFRRNPLPFYTLAQELYPGKFRPTITHAFIALLHKKGLLLKAFTQNIDCLEREAGVPDDLIVEAHGSFAQQRCIDCQKEYPAEDMLEFIKSKEVPYCQEENCGGLVKPDIVFFGEALPARFFENKGVPSQADLVIILGTSLTVHPFASLPQFASSGVPRLLINLERVGGIGSRQDDVLLLGDCDEGVRRLATALGWLEELEAEWAKTAPKEAAERMKKESNKSKDELLSDEVEKLTQEVDKTLKLADDTTKGTREFLDKHLKERQETGVRYRLEKELNALSPKEPSLSIEPEKAPSSSGLETPAPGLESAASTVEGSEKPESSTGQSTKLEK